MSTAAFDPYAQWLGIPAHEQPANYYRLLGLKLFESDLHAIVQACEQRANQVQSQAAGPHAALVRKLLGEIGAARHCLLDAGKKSAYDATLKSPAPKSEAADKYLGKTLGEYELFERSGGSKTGPIYKARHRQRGNVVTLKLLPPEATKSHDVVKRFRREVEVTTRLDHPNLMVAYEAGEQNGVHYLAMEYMSGADLFTLLEQQGPLAIDKATDYLLQTAKGLEYLHANGVYHRNIKPQNLLVDGRGTLKIANLLLARLEDGSVLAEGEIEDLTKTGTAMGSVDYLSPEQAADAKSADHRSDQYALGCTLYHLLTGQVIYPAKNMMQKIMQHRDAPIPSLRAVRSDVSEELDAMFQQMVAKQPEERYRSMQQIVRAIELPQGRPILHIVLPIAAIVLFLLIVGILFMWK